MAKKKANNSKWIMKITLLAFIISFIFSFISELALTNTGTIIGILILFTFIFLGVLFDMVGVAVTAADEKPIHSMNARKVHGADVATKFKKNADKVSSFCNDVVGDICGIISGSAGVVIAASLTSIIKIEPMYISLIVTALIAALTIGGKALGKGVAIKNSNSILFTFSKIVSYFYKPKK